MVVGTVLFVVGLGVTTIGPGMVVSDAPQPANPGRLQASETATSPPTERSQSTPATGGDADTPQQEVNGGETDDTDKSAGDQADEDDENDESDPPDEDDTDDSDEGGPPDGRGPPGEDGPPGKSKDKGKDK